MALNKLITNMNIINKTPYSFYFDIPKVGIVEIKPTENACEVIYKTHLLVTINGIKVNEKEPIEVINLPQIVKNTIYVVTPDVITALNDLSKFSSKYERSDVFALDENACVNCNNADISATCYYTSFTSTDYFSNMTRYYTAI